MRGMSFIPIFQMGKLRLTEVRELVLGSSSSQESQILLAAGRAQSWSPRLVPVGLGLSPFPGSGRQWEISSATA